MFRLNKETDMDRKPLAPRPLAPKPLALVIGATGGFGGATAAALLAHGWRVRALNRDPEAAASASPLPVEWTRGDAMVRDDVRRAAEGVKVVVHGANPPGYRNWKGLVLPMLENSLAAAGAEGARLLMPASVYNYGPDAFPLIDEAAPQNPLTRKGAIRVEVERRLRQANQAGTKTLTLRAGDFFGPGATNGWLQQGMVAPGKPLTAVTYPGPLGVRHAWAYLPDLGETAARLLDLEAELAADASFNFGGHQIDGHELLAAFEGLAGRKLAVRPFPWFALHAVAPFNETLRELLEMRYLWRDTVLLDNRRLAAQLGAEPHTPLAAALAATLAGLDVPLPEAALAA
jgi:nucleoside-diphosphate-sugar epimerase